MNGVDMRTVIIGIGGAGCNVISDARISHSMEVIAITADEKRYDTLDVGKKVLVKGDAVCETDDLRRMLSDYDVAYIVAGMGGRTGTYYAPLIASLAKELGIIVHSVLISPFNFESKRVTVAKDGIARMKASCGSTMVVENERSLERYGDLTMSEIFSKINHTIVGYIDRQQDVTLRTFHERLMGGEGTKIRTALMQRSLASY